MLHPAPLSREPAEDYHISTSREWAIEEFGAADLGDAQHFMRVTALFAVIAWRILYATLLGRLDADLSCEVLLQRFEWQALYCRTHTTTNPPKQPPTLGKAILWIAKIGGYLGEHAIDLLESRCSGAASFPARVRRCIRSSEKINDIMLRLFVGKPQVNGQGMLKRARETLFSQW